MKRRVYSVEARQDMEKIPGITEIGSWSEIKLQIVRDYAEAYSLILLKQSNIKHDYIDAFAGAGFHLSRETKGVIPGSPLMHSMLSRRSMSFT
jgi:hypothetical protein